MCSSQISASKASCRLFRVLSPSHPPCHRGLQSSERKLRGHRREGRHRQQRVSQLSAGSASCQLVGQALGYCHHLNVVIAPARSNMYVGCMLVKERFHDPPQQQPWHSQQSSTGAAKQGSQASGQAVQGPVWHTSGPTCRSGCSTTAAATTCHNHCQLGSSILA
jgi:hypothetical protein